jgi:hypothetical protein
MAGLWDPTAIGLGLPLDQNSDEVRSLTYTSEPLSQTLEITGSPQANLYIALEDGEDVNLVVKLSEVASDGRSSLITTGWLKASHQSSHAQPALLTKGTVYEFHVPLWATSYQVPQGHRLRVSVACADFPRIWPTLHNPTIRLFFGGSRTSGICFPTIPPAVVPGPEVRAPEPMVNRAPLTVDFTPQWKIEHDLASGTVTVTTGEHPVLLTPSRDGKMELNHTAKASVSASRPDTAKVEGETTVTLQTPSGSTVVVATRSWITLSGMILSGRISLDGRLFFEKQWKK